MFYGMRARKESLNLSSTARVDPAIRSFTLKAITRTDAERAISKVISKLKKLKRSLVMKKIYMYMNKRHKYSIC